MSKKNAQQNRSERAAAALAEQRRRERNRQFAVVGGVVLAIVLIVGVGVWIQTTRDPTQVAGGGKDVPAASGSDYGIAIGEEGAPHEVVIYEDFLCPFCGEFEKASREDLAQLASEGKVYVEYRPINFLSRFSDYSERATSAVFAVRDEDGAATAKKLHDLLYENQPSEEGPFPSDEDIVKLAVEAGADEAAVTQALDEESQKTAVANATDEASKAGVRATPTILLDGSQFTDGQTVDDLASNLADRLS